MPPGCLGHPYFTKKTGSITKLQIQHRSTNLIMQLLREITQTAAIKTYRNLFDNRGFISPSSLNIKSNYRPVMCGSVIMALWSISE